MNQNLFTFSHVTTSSVQKLISSLDITKLQGSMASVFSFYLQVTACWKKKRVTPLFKKGNTNDPNSFRPISILPGMMKIFEKVVHCQIVDFLDLSVS